MLHSPNILIAFWACVMGVLQEFNIRTKVLLQNLLYHMNFKCYDPVNKILTVRTEAKFCLKKCKSGIFLLQ